MKKGSFKNSIVRFVRQDVYDLINERREIDSSVLDGCVCSVSLTSFEILYIKFTINVTLLFEQDISFILSLYRHYRNMFGLGDDDNCDCGVTFDLKLRQISIALDMRKYFECELPF